MKETKDFYLNLTIRSNGDQMNALLLILHLIPIITPPSIDRNSVMYIQIEKIMNIDTYRGGPRSNKH